jgi:hypothetical protein
MKFRRIIIAALLLLLMLGLWYTSPERLFPECRGTSVPRYCVD